MVTSVLASTVLVVFGRYSTIERVTTAIGVALGVASVIAASTVVSSFRTVAAGLRPAFPPETDYGEVLPWLGFMLSGAAGMMWYSYWLVEKKYGMAGVNPNSAASPKSLRAADRTRLRGWIAQMTVDNTVAVIGTLAVVAAFLVLGTELLRPQRLIPEEDQIANTLGRLLGSVWGPIGFWFMVVAVFVGFWDTVLADQDGHGRLFANGTRILLQKHGLRGRFSDDMLLRRLFVLVLVSACPIALYLTIGQPVRLLKFAGAVEAAHIPLVTALTLYLNHRTLPEDLRPSWPIAVATGIAGLFFLVFAGFYVVQLPS